MVIKTLEEKVNAFFDKLIAKYDGWLPFHGKYLNEARQVILANLDKAKAVFVVMFDQDWDKGVDWLIFLLKGNLKFPWLPGFVTDWAWNLLAQWLHAHKDDFKDQIGTFGDPAPVAA